MKCKFTALLDCLSLSNRRGDFKLRQKSLQANAASLIVLGMGLIAPTVFSQDVSNGTNSVVSGGKSAPQNAGASNNELSGQQLIQAATLNTAEHKTIQARLRVRTDLLGQPLIGSGSYAQLASNVGPLLRLELAIQAGEQATSVKQISDGRVMWEAWRIGGSTKLNRIDLRRVEAAVRNAGGSAVSSSTSASLATGGLPKLLKQLDENFDFNTKSVRQGTIGEVPVFLLAGGWKAEKLAALTPESVEGNTIYFEKLPVHLPHQVEILVGIQDHFPYRVTYQRWKPTDGQLTLSPVVTTEFFDVVIDDPLDQSQFQFHKPQEMTVTDRTDVFLQSMGLKPVRR